MSKKQTAVKDPNPTQGTDGGQQLTTGQPEPAASTGSVQPPTMGQSGHTVGRGPGPLMIGRIVHYRQSAEDSALHGGAEGSVCAAIVTRVHSESAINITVFADASHPYGRLTVLEGLEPGTWAWPNPNAR